MLGCRGGFRGQFNFPLAWEGVLLMFSAIIVGPFLVLVRSVNAERSKLVTKAPVAPESRIAYLLED